MIMTAERLLLLIRLGRIWKIFLFGSFWFLLFIYLIEHKPKRSADKFNQQPGNPKCNGTFLNPNNTALYRNIGTNPQCTPENWRTFEQNFFDEMTNLYTRFHTVIFDCSMLLKASSRNYSLYNYAFLMAVARFNQERGWPMMNVWLRLDRQNENSFSITACIDAAENYNKIFPGSIRGVLGSSETLMTSVKQKSIFYWKNNQPACKLYSEECFELLSAQGIQFGLILNTVNCKKFPSSVPAQLIRKFDKIFYLERDRFQMTLENNVTIVPTLSVSNDFIKCKNHIAKVVPYYTKEINYIIREKFETQQPHWKNTLYPYCLNLEEALLFLKKYNLQ